MTDTCELSHFDTTQNVTNVQKKRTAGDYTLSPLYSNVQLKSTKANCKITVRQNCLLQTAFETEGSTNKPFSNERRIR